jgi:hypothetical protein
MAVPHLCHSSQRPTSAFARWDRDYAAYVDCSNRSPAGRGQAGGRSGSAYRSAFRRFPSTRVLETGRHGFRAAYRRREFGTGEPWWILVSGRPCEITGCSRRSSASMKMRATSTSRGSDRWKDPAPCQMRAGVISGTPTKPAAEPLHKRIVLPVRKNYVQLRYTALPPSSAVGRAFIAMPRGSPQDQDRSEYRSLAVIRNAHTA